MTLPNGFATGLIIEFFMIWLISVNDFSNSKSLILPLKVYAGFFLSATFVATCLGIVACLLGQLPTTGLLLLGAFNLVVAVPLVAIDYRKDPEFYQDLKRGRRHW